MFIRNLKDCKAFVAADNTVVRELLHPAKADLNLGYSLAHAVLKPGQTSTPHRLKTSEVYYILTGEGSMHVDDDMAIVYANQAIYIYIYIYTTRKAVYKKYWNTRFRIFVYS